MSNLYKYHKYKEGDKVICLLTYYEPMHNHITHFTKGKVYTLTRAPSEECTTLNMLDDNNEQNGWWIGYFIPYSPLALLVVK